MASSVLPKPTSPHNNRSIGRGSSMSLLIAAIDVNWSGVSRYGNEASNSRCQDVSPVKRMPGREAREACSVSMSAARSVTAARAADVG